MNRRRNIVWMSIALAAAVAVVSNAAAGRSTGAWLDVSLSSTSQSTVSGPTVAYGTPYVVTGCGFDAANGGVTVVVQTPDATAFAGQLPDGNGCISISNFSTQSAGSYTASAYQTVHKKASLMASTTFTIN